MPPDIRHVVFLMQENQSFDRMLGWLPPEKYDVAENVDDITIFPGQGQEWLGPPFKVRRATGAVRQQCFPVPHQPGTWLRKGYWKNAPDGKPSDHATARQPTVVAEELSRARVAHVFRDKHRTDDRVTALGRAIIAQSFKHLTAAEVPVYKFFADNFLVCDRWFSTECSFTWPNRMALVQDKRWAFGDPAAAGLKELLASRGIPLEILGYGYGASTMNWLSPTGEGYTGKFGVETWRSQLDRVFGRWNQERERPHFLWVESTHLKSRAPGHGPLWGPRDRPLSNDHHGSSILDGQAFVKDVYDSLRHYEEVWKNALFVLTYDEHGGWYDHVIPERAPWAPAGTDRWRDRYGGRVPAFVVSPWARHGALSDTLDHTSLLAWIARHFPRSPGKTEAKLGLSAFHEADPFRNAWEAGLRETPKHALDPWVGFEKEVERSKPVSLARHFPETGDPDWFTGEIPEGAHDLQTEIGDTIAGKDVDRDSGRV